MENKKPNILCLSFRTPPAIRPQAILIDKMINEWTRRGLSPVVVTLNDNGRWNTDLPVYTLPPFSINRYLSRLQPLRNWLLDLYFKKSCSKIEEIIKKHDIDLIFSFSNPIDTNIIGAMLKRRTKVRFVSHFSDPWYDHPFSDLSGPVAARMLAQETEIMEQSDRIVFVTKEMRDLVMGKYPPAYREKTEIIPHCFNPDDYPAKKASNRKFILSYVGAFYKQRNPEILFAAFQEIIGRHHELKDNFRLQLIGTDVDYTDFKHKNLAGMISSHGLEDYIELIPPVPYLASLKYMVAADCLVVIDANEPASPFLPSKVVDYAGSGTMILGITPDNSPTSQFLNGLGYPSFNYQQSKELADYLADLIRGKILPAADQAFLENYNVRNTQGKLLDIFNGLINDGACR